MKSALISFCSILLISSALAAQEKDCSNTSEGLVPINDLGSGAYMGLQGGLYPGGSNVRPPEHEESGIELSRQVVPRDAEGEVDLETGKIVLMSVGMSATFQEFARFIQDASMLPGLNPDLVLFNGAEGGESLEEMAEPDSPYWSRLMRRISRAGLSPDQIQAVWLKQAYDIPRSEDFSENSQLMAIDLARTVNNIKRLFPNVFLCYCTSRIYGGYTTNPFRNEPVSYESGFGFKLLIEAQIEGHPALNYDPAMGPVRSPWLSWGPYMWADGLNARSDGLVWECDDFEDDGYHPAEGAEEKMSSALIDFFITDATSIGWFLEAGIQGPEDSLK